MRLDYCFSGGQQSNKTAIYMKVSELPLNSQNNIPNPLLGIRNSDNPVVRFRRFAKTNSTTIAFANCIADNTSGTYYNGNCIPQAIYGLK